MKKITFLFLLGMIGSAKAQVNLTSSLTACYALDGNATEPINNFTGTLSSVSPTLGHLGAANTALYFSGNNSSYVQLPNNSMLKPNEISFSAWVKASVLYSNQAIVFTKNTQSSFFTAYTIAIFSGSFVVCRQDANTTDLLYSTTAVTLNTWYHVAFSMDISTAKIYVNGVLEGSMNLGSTGFNYDPTRNVLLGGTNEPFNNYFNGSIDNVRFYNRILNNSEVSALYAEDVFCSEIATEIPKRQTLLSGAFIYPNPAKEIVKISGGNGLPYTYVVNDLLGKEIFTSGLPLEESSDYLIQDLPAGIYFITIKSENSPKTFKLIKE